jgi:hypothetical protein
MPNAVKVLKKKLGRPVLYDDKTEETALMLREKDLAFLTTWGQHFHGRTISRSDALADIIARFKELHWEVQEAREQVQRLRKELEKRRAELEDYRKRRR